RQTAALRDGSLRRLLLSAAQGGPVSAHRGGAGGARPGQRQPRRGRPAVGHSRPAEGGVARRVGAAATRHRGTAALPPAPPAAGAAPLPDVVEALAGRGRGGVRFAAGVGGLPYMRGPLCTPKG